MKGGYRGDEYQQIQSNPSRDACNRTRERNHVSVRNSAAADNVAIACDVQAVASSGNRSRPRAVEADPVAGDDVVVGHDVDGVVELTADNQATDGAAVGSSLQEKAVISNIDVRGDTDKGLTAEAALSGGVEIYRVGDGG